MGSIFLNKDDYSWSNTLSFQLSCKHFDQVSSKSYFLSGYHITVGTVQCIPLISQIVSMFEKLLSFMFQKDAKSTPLTEKTVTKEETNTQEPSPIDNLDVPSLIQTINQSPTRTPEENLDNPPADNIAVSQNEPVLTQAVPESSNTEEPVQLQTGLSQRKFASLNELLDHLKKYIDYDKLKSSLVQHKETKSFFVRDATLFALNDWNASKEKNLEELKKLIAYKIRYIEELVEKNDKSVSIEVRNLDVWALCLQHCLENVPMTGWPPKERIRFELSDQPSACKNVIEENYQKDKNRLMSEIERMRQRGAYNPLCDEEFQLLSLEIKRWLSGDQSEAGLAELKQLVQKQGMATKEFLPLYSQIIG